MTLLCHPATPAPVVRAVEASAMMRADGGLSLAFRVWGDMVRLLIPMTGASERTDLLWEHTCFEAFVAGAGEPAYREFNFSPSGQWAAYAFSDYRQRDEALAINNAPQITSRLYAGRMEIEARLAPGGLPACAGGLQIGLAAVIEAADVVDGSHSYWALRHPALRPDFHHRDAFSLELGGPRNSV
ncbi:MAG: DOMON-like domain-containing protein [Propionivibrio sp.]|uniref:DOMON-like domain-containing protein n=1 Tax=Candidatus Propionivibrio dominans TaxID=2954373 RepID=A0A9D7FDQ9_9RHOO|nr:DOMON-like domain-containing protein [Candidatus Propionivibrio dominans]